MGSEAIDLKGQRFGSLTVLYRVENKKGKAARWMCLCDCGNTKEIDGTHIRRGIGNKCRECYLKSIPKGRDLEKRRETYRKWFKLNKEKKKLQQLNRYHTVSGWIMESHHSMKKRVKSEVQQHVNKCCSLEEFEIFVKNSDVFPLIFSNWIKSGFSKNDAPSVDRINHLFGYTIDNIQIITYKQNIIKGLAERRGTTGHPVVVMGSGAAHVFPSMGDAADKLFLSRSAVKNAVRQGGKCIGMEVFKIQ